MVGFAKLEHRHHWAKPENSGIKRFREMCRTSEVINFLLMPNKLSSNSSSVCTPRLRVRIVAAPLW